MANLNRPTSNDTSLPGAGGTDLAEHGDAQMPLGVGGFSDSMNGGGGLADETPRPKINSSAAIVGLLLVCAAGGLFWMRSMSSSSNTAFAANSEMESRIDSFLEATVVNGSASDQGESVIRALTEDRTRQQVDVKDVKKNPLILPTDENTGTPTTSNNTGPDPQDEREKLRDAARKKIEDASKQIVVNSIMSGTNPLASLNGKIVRVGDTVVVGPEKIKFTVEEIGTDSVELAAESKEFDLSLGFSVSLKR